MTTTLFIIAAMVFVPWLVARILRIDSVIPLPMLQIAFGIMLGPSALGAFYPEIWQSVFTSGVRASLDTIQTLAIVIFAFIAGIELKPREVLDREGHGLWLKALQVVLVPILLAAGAFWLFFDSAQWHAPQVDPWKYFWAMGVATCITAMPMLAVACKNLGLYGTALYQRLLALVTFDDLILWLTVSLIVVFGQTVITAGLFMLAVLMLYHVWPRIMERAGPAAWPTLTVAMTLIMAATSYWAGLHWVLGAFFAGMITPRHTTGWNEGMAEQQMFWLMPVFFIWTGLKAQWSVDFAVIAGAALVMLIIAVTTKFVGVWLAYRSEGGNMVLLKTSLLQTKGLMEIFLATVLLKANIISDNMFAAVVVMSVISTVIAVPLAKIFLRKIPQ